MPISTNSKLQCISFNEKVVCLIYIPKTLFSVSQIFYEHKRKSYDKPNQVINRTQHTKHYLFHSCSLDDNIHHRHTNHQKEYNSLTS